VSFYHKFIGNFSEIGGQMMDTVKKIHKSFKWTEEAEKRFNMFDVGASPTSTRGGTT
jgi:hypothetical protein